MIKKCTKCRLHKYRRNIVHGRGSIPADIIIIGEAPGMTEDMWGEAFIGKAGQLLDQIIYKATTECTLPHVPTIYFTNTVLCHPCDRRGGTNRQPTMDEILSCSENVWNIIDKVNPSYFILCGDIAEKIMKNKIKHYTKIMHPSAILRHGGRSSGYFLENVRKIQHVFEEVYL